MASPAINASVTESKSGSFRQQHRKGNVLAIWHEKVVLEAHRKTDSIF